MKLRTKILLWCSAVCMIALAVYAANPSFSDFTLQQFSTTGNKVTIKDGSCQSNIQHFGVFSLSNIVAGIASSNITLTPAVSTLTIGRSGYNALNIDTVAGGAADFAGPVRSLSFGKFVGITNTLLSVSQLIGTDSAGGQASIAVGTGLSLSGGTLSATGGGGGATTNAILQATNIIGIHDSICIPASAYYSFNLLTPSTNATFIQVTNLCQGWVFADGITNEVRARFSLPYDWDGGTVQMQLNALCTGTNTQGAANQTNVVFAVAAAALPSQADLSSPTFGTAVAVTNRINAAAFVEGVAYTQPITVGNSPNATKSILWQIQRLGAATGDTVTNSALVLTETRIFFTRNLTTTNAPTASP